MEVADLLSGETYAHAIFLYAVEQGNVAGLNILGIDNRYERAHWMNNLKHLDLPIMAAGLKTGDQVFANQERCQFEESVFIRKSGSGFPIGG